MWSILFTAAIAADSVSVRAEALQTELGPGFTVLAEGPWVVAGDESPDVVRGRAKATVRWASDRLQAAYFSSPPEPGWTIWLFKDSDSYMFHARARWGETPHTPYGYAAHRDLVMNIATGGGTLVHEMVHPYVASNFPQAPTWFDEGLASLYEQSADRDGRIVGLTNWRLAALQAALSAKRVPSMATFMAQDRRAFYDADPGTNYAQGRYLLLWLQNEGLLGRYYRALHAGIDDDPTGLQTFIEVAGIDGVDDLDRFERRWARWVLGLHFP